MTHPLVHLMPAAIAAAPATPARPRGRPRKDPLAPLPPAPNYPPPAQETAGVVSTAQAAFYVRRTTYTLHRWSTAADAPLKPIRTGRGAALMWAMSDIRKFLRIDQS